MRPCRNRVAKKRDFNKLEYIKDLTDGRQLFLCKYRDSSIVQCSGKGYLNKNGDFKVVKDHNHPIDDGFNVSDSDACRPEEKKTPARNEDIEKETEAMECEPSKEEEAPQKTKATKRKHKFTVSSEVYQRAMECKPEKFRVMRNGRWHADPFFRVGAFEGAPSDFTSVLEQTRERGEINFDEEPAVSPHAPSSVSEASTSDMSGRRVVYDKRLQSIEEDFKNAEKNSHDGHFEDEEETPFVQQCLRQVEQLGPEAETRLHFRLQEVILADTNAKEKKKEDLLNQKAHLENLNAMIEAMNAKGYK